MRISGVRPGYVRWAAAGTGVVLLGVIIAVLVSVFGILGDDGDDAGTTVAATVVTGTPCDARGATETVTFTLDGRERSARFDGCGHREGEPVDISVPPGAAGAGDDLVVHAAQATRGTSGPGAGLGLILIVLSGVAGAGYAFLIRRGPRSTRLPPALRLA